MPNKADKANIWVVTHGNDTPYAYVTATSWGDALTAADNHPEVTFERAKDGGYAIRRLQAWEVELLTPDQLSEAERNAA